MFLKQYLDTHSNLCFNALKGGECLGGDDHSQRSDPRQHRRDAPAGAQRARQLWYEIIKTITQRTGGRYELKEPSLYTSLKRLERDGCVQSYWGDASQGARRKYYRITPAGAALLHDAVEQWRAARDIIDCVLIGGEEHG